MCGICEAAMLEMDCGVKGPGALKAEVGGRFTSLFGDAGTRFDGFGSRIDALVEWLGTPDDDSGAVAPVTGSAAETWETGSAIPGDESIIDAISSRERRFETLEETGDSDWYRLELDDNQTVRISAFGWDHDRLNGIGELGDPLLRLYDENGHVVAENDDIILESLRDSSMVYRAQAAGTYYVEVTSFEGALAGDYMLGVRNALPFFAPDRLDPTDALRGGTQLNDNDTILVYFAESGENYNYNGDTFTATGTNSYEQTQLFSVFEGIEDFTALDFEVTTNRAAADLQVGTSVLPSVANGTLIGFFLFPSGNGDGNYGFLNNNPTNVPFWSDEAGGSLDDGGFMYGIAIHEFGHALGLGHPHDVGNGSDVMLGVNDANDRGSFDLNSAAYTSMSYNEGSVLAGVAPMQASTGHALTYGALDIAVLQEFYGTNTSHAAGDDTYDLWLSNGTGSGAGYHTIWDTGGTDTIRYSGPADAVIDLRAATLSYSDGGGGYLSYVDGVIGGYTIANGVVVEDAIGGGGDDTVTGNGAANMLAGGDGDNTMYGLAGNDTFELFDADGDNVCYGGTGVDTADYGPLQSGDFDISGSGGDWIIADKFSDNVDTLYAVERLDFGDTVLSA